jgi:two-component system sensor histidine kinase KdpD
MIVPAARRRTVLRLLRGAAVWLAAWALMFAADGHLDLGSQALLLVVAAAVAALWLPAAPSVLGSGLAVLLFNYSFVPPRGTLRVDLQQDATLLVTMLAVSALVATLVSRQRRLAARERAQHARTRQLREFGETLRDADDPLSQAPALQGALAWLAGGSATLLLPGSGDGTLLGTATPAERVALSLSLRSGEVRGEAGAAGALAWYLPLRGRGGALGAALVRADAVPADADELRTQAQALCDQMGLALERSAALRAAAEARASSQAQALRSTLLAAVAHDHRTPLAAILGAASSLRDQGERLTDAQRQRLAAAIVDEAEQLRRLTDNTLQLARLDTPGVALHLDWESPEELVGTVVRRLRQRTPLAAIATAVEPALPLVRCDAVLLVQLLENLVDNALTHGPEDGPVEVAARRDGARLVLAVADRGPGVPEAWRERVFDVFQRGPQAQRNERARRGAGVGLAVCHAIARAHGGELTLQPREGGGAVFEAALPLTAPPAAAQEAPE